MAGLHTDTCNLTQVAYQKSSSRRVAYMLQ